MARILVSEPVSASGLERLRELKQAQIDYRPDLTRADLEAIIVDYDALVVRSATKVDAALIERATTLKLIGRAGVGVDNVDVKAATRAGVVVMNTPGGNRFAVAELALSLMLNCLRPVVEACATMRGGGWDKKRFGGRELRGKTVGLLGLGRIGLEVAQRVRAFDAHVIGHDPYLSEGATAALADRVEAVSFDDLLARADILSLHIPLTPETRGLLGRERLAAMKKGAILINAARGGVVDEAALLAALDEGHLAMAATDVFEEESPAADHPLRVHPKVIVTPHIGASTKEASEGVMTQLTDQIVAYFGSGQIMNAVNVPVGDLAQVRKFGPYLELARRVGTIFSSLVKGPVTELSVETQGELKDPSLFGLNLLIGYLNPLEGGTVNMVNALVRARERGIETTHTYASRPGSLRNEITLAAKSAGETWTIRGALGIRKEPVITEINGFGFEIVADQALLFLRNKDVPGAIGRIGTWLGAAGINIEELRLAKKADDPLAFVILKLAAPLSDSRLAALRTLDNVADARVADLTGI